MIRDMPVRRAIDDALARPPFAANIAPISSSLPLPSVASASALSGPLPSVSAALAPSACPVSRQADASRVDSANVGGSDEEDDEVEEHRAAVNNCSDALRRRPSDAALDLIERLMEKDPTQRCDSLCFFSSCKNSPVETPLSVLVLGLCLSQCMHNLLRCIASVV